MSTSSPGDTPANRSQRQAKGKAKKTRGISGLTSSTPFAQYNPDTHLWKTCEATLLSDSETFSPTLPPAGILRNGRLFQRPRLAPLTDATASSSWPTPTAAGDVSNIKGKFSNLTLGDAVRKWPTPTASDHRRRGPNSHQQGLPEKVATIENSWSPEHGGKLNPEWVGWLMGFPPGWTDLEDSETLSSLKSPNSSEG